MHESYEDDYYDDNYDDSQDYDQSQSDWNKFYFKFDVSSNPFSDWVKKMMNELMKKSPSSKKINWEDIGKIKDISDGAGVWLSVNNWLQNTDSGLNSLLYLGVNYQGQPIWKNKHFVIEKTQTDYINHLSSNAVHFVKQPSYYKGLFDILN